MFRERSELRILGRLLPIIVRHLPMRVRMMGVCIQNSAEPHQPLFLKIVLQQQTRQLHPNRQVVGKLQSVTSQRPALLKIESSLSSERQMRLGLFGPPRQTQRRPKLKTETNVVRRLIGCRLQNLDGSTDLSGSKQRFTKCLAGIDQLWMSANDVF